MEDESEKIRNKLTKGFVWEAQWALRRGKRGRAMGEMLIGVWEELKMEKEGKRKEEKGLISRRIRLGRDLWRIIGVYVNKDMERKIESLREWMEEKEEGVKMLVGGDFNARTGREGKRTRREEVEEEEKWNRNSKDRKVNKEGRYLCTFLEELGWEIMNGGMKEDEEGEFTYTGKGETVIDYAIGNEETRKKVERLVVEEKMDSDH